MDRLLGVCGLKGEVRQRLIMGEEPLPLWEEGTRIVGPLFCKDIRERREVALKMSHSFLEGMCLFVLIMFFWLAPKCGWWVSTVSIFRGGWVTTVLQLY